MKTKHGWLVLIAILSTSAIYSAGCGKNNPLTGGNAGSCTTVSSGITTCFDYTGAGFTSATAQSTCSTTTSGGSAGTYSASACTTTGRIGSCLVSGGQASEYTVRYLGGYNSTTAPAACSSLSGTYTAG